MKKSFLIITLCLFIHSLFSQGINIDTLKSQIEKTPYVFKGEIIDIQYYLGDKYGNKLPHLVLPNGEPGYVYSSAKVKICQILKGEDKLKQGTVEIITCDSNQIKAFILLDKNGDSTFITFDLAYGSHSLFIREKFSAIFFCKDARYKGKSSFEFDNSFGIYPTFPGMPLINMNWVKNEIYAGMGAAKKTFYSPYEFYAFLKQLGLNTNSYDYCREEENRIEKLKSDSLNKIKNDSLNIKFDTNKI